MLCLWLNHISLNWTLLNKTSLFGFSSSVLGMKYMQAKRLKFLEIYNYGLNFLSNSWPYFLTEKKTVTRNVDRSIRNINPEKKSTCNKCTCHNRINFGKIQHPTHFVKIKCYMDSTDETLVYTLTPFIHKSTSNHPLWKFFHLPLIFWIACIQIVFCFLFC